MIKETKSGEKLTTGLLNNIIRAVNGQEIPYTGQFTRTEKGALLVEDLIEDQKVYPTSHEEFLTVRCVNTWQLEQRPFDIGDYTKKKDNILFINLGPDLATAKSLLMLNNKPVDEILFVNARKQDLSTKVYDDFFDQANSSEFRNSHEVNTGFLHTGMTSTSPVEGGFYRFDGRIVVYAISDYRLSLDDTVAVIKMKELLGLPLTVPVEKFGITQLYGYTKPSEKGFSTYISLLQGAQRCYDEPFIPPVDSQLSILELSSLEELTKTVETEEVDGEGNKISVDLTYRQLFDFDDGEVVKNPELSDHNFVTRWIDPESNKKIIKYVNLSALSSIPPDTDVFNDSQQKSVQTMISNDVKFLEIYDFHNKKNEKKYSMDDLGDFDKVNVLVRNMKDHEIHYTTLESYNDAIEDISADLSALKPDNEVFNASQQRSIQIHEKNNTKFTELYDFHDKNNEKNYTLEELGTFNIVNFPVRNMENHEIHYTSLSAYNEALSSVSSDISVISNDIDIISNYIIIISADLSAMKPDNEVFNASQQRSIQIHEKNNVKFTELYDFHNDNNNRNYTMDDLGNFNKVNVLVRNMERDELHYTSLSAYNEALSSVSSDISVISNDISVISNDIDIIINNISVISNDIIVISGDLSALKPDNEVFNASQQRSIQIHEKNNVKFTELYDFHNDNNNRNYTMDDLGNFNKVNVLVRNMELDELHYTSLSAYNEALSSVSSDIDIINNDLSALTPDTEVMEFSRQKSIQIHEENNVKFTELYDFHNELNVYGADDMKPYDLLDVVVRNRSTSVDMNEVNYIDMSAITMYDSDYTGADHNSQSLERKYDKYIYDTVDTRTLTPANRPYGQLYNFDNIEMNAYTPNDFKSYDDETGGFYGDGIVIRKSRKVGDTYHNYISYMPPEMLSNWSNPVEGDTDVYEKHHTHLIHPNEYPTDSIELIKVNEINNNSEAYYSLRNFAHFNQGAVDNQLDWGTTNDIATGATSVYPELPDVEFLCRVYDDNTQRYQLDYKKIYVGLPELPEPEVTQDDIDEITEDIEELSNDLSSLSVSLSGLSGDFWVSSGSSETNYGSDIGNTLGDIPIDLDNYIFRSQNNEWYFDCGLLVGDSNRGYLDVCGSSLVVQPDSVDAGTKMNFHNGIEVINGSIKIGQTVLTEEKLQQLLQLIA